MAADARLLAAMVLRKRVERFASQLRDNMPRGRSAHGRARGTPVTLVGAVTFERTIFPD